MQDAAASGECSVTTGSIAFAEFHNGVQQSTSLTISDLRRGGFEMFRCFEDTFFFWEQKIMTMAH